MAISITWGTGVIYVPKADMTLIQSSPTEIRELNLDNFRLTLKDLEDSFEGMPYTKTHIHYPSVSVGGVQLARVINLLEPYTITFEDGQYAVNLVGANSNVGDRVNVNQVSVRSSNSAGLIQTREIEYSSFENGVTIDVVNGVAGEKYPTGTKLQPVNNLIDAKNIAVTRGFNKLFIKSNMTLNNGDNIDGYEVQALYHEAAILTLNTGCSNVGSVFIDLDIEGEFNGDCHLIRCNITPNGVTGAEGEYIQCMIRGDITTNSSADLQILNCWSATTGVNYPTIECIGSVSIGIRGHAGIIGISGLTAGSITADFIAGGLNVNNTCTGGIINTRALDSLIDEAQGTIVTAYTYDPDIINVKQLLESLRKDHSATGNVWYWDPINGSNLYSGTSPDRAFATFAAAHAAASDYGHDVIIAIPGNQAGTTISTENLVITKNYIFLRGPGRDFLISSANDALDCINITGEGVQVAKVRIGENPTNTKHAVWSSGNFLLLEDIIVNDTNKGVEIYGGNRVNIKGLDSQDNLSYGLKIAGGATRVNINKVHLGDNGGDGLIIDNAGGNDISIESGNIIHGNAGYGINITAASTGVILHHDNHVFGNTLGDINDLASDTFNEKTVSLEEETDAMWNHIIEADGNITAKQIQAIALAALAGKVEVSPDGTTITFKTPAGNFTRMISTTTSTGARTNIQLSP